MRSIGIDLAAGPATTAVAVLHWAAPTSPYGRPSPRACSRCPFPYKLGATAAHWAHLTDELAHRGHPVERTGTGPVVEVYPKAARLMTAAPFLHCSPQVREEYERNEHAFDALVATLVARACAKGLTRPPELEDAPAAAVEGWIHLPEAGSLHSLL
ncbi:MULTISPECIES: hypothetical protein [unclassified Kitasatospora]|uniref:hypothetical protein n=1 Tax=unclassified Kitasatospora TaxID=2633591 RepID=UPI00340FC633